ncbi:MAG: hypothetical protein QW086_06365 [Pyrobaculum sp.]
MGYVMNKREVYVLIIGGGPAGIGTFHVSETVSIDIKVEIVQKEEEVLMPCGIPYTGVSAPLERNAIPALL